MQGPVWGCLHVQYSKHQNVAKLWTETRCCRAQKEAEKEKARLEKEAEKERLRQDKEAARKEKEVSTKQADALNEQRQQIAVLIVIAGHVCNHCAASRVCIYTNFSISEDTLIALT